MSTMIDSAASTAWARVSATTAATMSPTNRTTPLASGGRLKTGGSMMKPCTSGSSRFSLVYTATTPGMLAASVVSTPLIRAWAIVLRTNTM